MANEGNSAPSWDIPADGKLLALDWSASIPTFSEMSWQKPCHKRRLQECCSWLARARPGSLVS